MSFHFYADDTQLYVSFKSSISGDLSRAPSTLEACARDINKWMLCNKIKLNDDKTEMLKHRPAPLLDQLQVATSLSPVPLLQIILELFSTRRFHLTNTLRKFSNLRFILSGTFRASSSLQTAKILVHALVTSKLDNCNSLFYGLPKNLLQRLQYVLNSAARLVTLSRKSGHVTPLQLHWLAVEQRTEFKGLFYI